MPETFDAVLRDHGGWAGVLSRSTSNAKRAIAAEETKKVNKAAKEKEARKQAITGFHKMVAHTSKCIKLMKATEARAMETVLAQDEQLQGSMDELNLEMVKNMQLTSAHVLRVFGLA